MAPEKLDVKYTIPKGYILEIPESDPIPNGWEKVEDFDSRIILGVKYIPIRKK